jgi:alkylhydroperoxidase family enzyme
MSSALANVAWEPCMVPSRPDREIDAYARKRMGLPNPALRYFAPVPWLARAVVDLHGEFGLLMHLEQRVADLVGMVVSQENSCRYCFAAYRAMLWLQGMDRARIERLERELSSGELPPRVRAAIALGRGQSRSGPQGMREAWRAMRREGVGAEELREIAFTVAITDFSNRVHTIPAIPAQPFERMPEQWHVRLLRPLLARVLRKRHSRGQEMSPAPKPSYLYGEVVAAYAGSPIAGILDRTLREMWASPHLSRRCKLLMFAVIARGLPCERCVLEVGDALEREGLSKPMLAQVLAHLDAPGLEPAERLLVAFARETIWYEPAVLQRRARALREQLDNDEQFLEAVGVVAIANGLCRMAATVVEEPA